MNIKRITKYFVMLFASVIALTSCLDDLNTVPLDEDITTSADVYNDINNYKQVLAKCYAGLATTGQEGPAGDADVGGIDEGFSSYIRGYWNLQELTTEEAVTGWGDDGLQDLHNHIWTAGNDFVKGLYYRVFYQIAIANEFIRNSTDAKLTELGATDAQKTEIAYFHQEARFLRALSYWHALDMFGSVPFVTEDDGVGAYFPEQISKADLFEYIESELLDMESQMVEPMMNEYGRADQAAAWMLLSKLYLNAEVYTGTAKYTEAANYSKKVIDAGYDLDPTYQNLFMADNHTADGLIFSVAFDGVETKTWGGTTFIIDGAIGGSMVPADFGVNQNWGGHRTTSAFVHKFPQYADAARMPVQKANADYPILHVPGAYQGWDAANNETVIYSRSSDDIYEGYIYMAEAGEFKFDVNGDWSVNYGDDDADGTLDAGGANISVADPGLYKINVDLNLMTYTVEQTTWGVIGSATADGWDSDQAMALDENGNYSIEVKLTAGEIKFRANSAWDLDFGDNAADGLLEYGGSNITITEPGKYNITLLLSVADYTYSLVKSSSDERALFHTDGQSLEIDLIADFTNGYAITKWSNMTSTGEAGSDLTHTDTDFPIFRLADAYLTYAEAALQGGGDMSLALDYVNEVRTRAYTDESGNIEAADLTMDFILDERAREFYWEGQRRTDLIRHEKFTGDTYIWPWKGGVKEGKSIDAKYAIFPIPSSDIIANPNLEQNDNY